ncbi:hypothetical protein EV368DRAFT_83735 [Lentinula lateritia]|nr:hypothetical protein EV368DRAFT_83735 [Lentinula lateritia]
MHFIAPASLFYILLMGFISVVNAVPTTIKATYNANSNIVPKCHLESGTGQHHQAGEGVQHSAIVVYITSIRAVVTTGQLPHKQPKFQDEAVQSRLEARLEFYFEHTWKCNVVIKFVENVEFKMEDVEGDFSFKYTNSSDSKFIRSGFVHESNPTPFPPSGSSPSSAGTVSPLGSSYDALDSHKIVHLQVPQES